MTTTLTAPFGITGLIMASRSGNTYQINPATNQVSVADVDVPDLIAYGFSTGAQGPVITPQSGPADTVFNE